MKRLGIMSLACCGIMLGLQTQAMAQGFVPQKGTVWGKVGYIYGEATENFAGRDEVFFAPNTELGARVPFRSREGKVVGGKLTLNQLTLDAIWVPIDRLMIGTFIPLLTRPFYSNTTNDYTTRKLGLGDINLFTGYQITPMEQYNVGVTAYLKAKIPTSFNLPYTNQALRGEGQFDLSAALGTTFVLAPKVHINTTFEYKVRFAYDGDEGRADPGDELHFTGGIGSGLIDKVWLSLNYSGFWGQEWEIEYADGEQRQTKRQYHAVGFGAYVDLGSITPGLALDAWAKLPFAGRDHAVMRSLGIGVAKSF